MVEYIDQQINHLSWQVTSKIGDLTSSDCCGDKLISGSRNCLSIWQFLDKSGTFDQLPVAEIANEKTPASVAKVHLIGDIAFTALIDGTVLLHSLESGDTINNCKLLELISETRDLHSTYRCNDMLFCPQTKSVITCGSDGALSRFDIDHPKKVIKKQLCDSSLRCMDMVTPNEVICGTLNGNLKHFDLRENICIGNFANQSLSTLTSIQKNPNVNHLAVGGNDQGSILLYDLRNQNSALVEISAHNAAITNIRYRPRDTNILYSSSCDGELFRWRLNPEFTTTQIPKKVESISCTSDPISITSFDVNHLGDMIYTTDHGAIFYHKLTEIGY